MWIFQNSSENCGRSCCCCWGGLWLIFVYETWWVNPGPGHDVSKLQAQALGVVRFHMLWKGEDPLFKVHEQWKKCPWLFRVDRGWNTTQVYRDYNKPWNKDPSWTTLMEVRIRRFFFFRGNHGLLDDSHPRYFPLRGVVAPFFLVGRILEVNHRQSARTWILFAENQFWSIKENLHLSMYCIYLSILSI